MSITEQLIEAIHSVEIKDFRMQREMEKLDMTTVSQTQYEYRSTGQITIIINAFEKQ